MKTFLFILIITGFAVYLAGAAWYYIDRRKGGQRKTPMLLRAVGALLMAAYFILLIIISHRSDRTAAAQRAPLTPEAAYEGVSNYCHETFDWSVAETNPDLMSLTMGEETPTEYQVVFRSYTGALTYFYVDKATGATRMEEYVPALDLRNAAGTLDLYDYLDK